VDPDDHGTILFIVFAINIRLDLQVTHMLVGISLHVDLSNYSIDQESRYDEVADYPADGPSCFSQHDMY